MQVGGDPHRPGSAVQWTMRTWSFDDAFDGIWGTEALIHVPEDEPPGILKTDRGACARTESYSLPFQEGDFEGQRSGRYFCGVYTGRLERILTETGRLKILKLWTTEDEDREAGDKLSM